MSKISKPNLDKPWFRKCSEHTAYYKKIKTTLGAHGSGTTSIHYLCKVCDKDVRIPSKESGQMRLVSIILLIFSIINAGVYHYLDRY